MDFPDQAQLIAPDKIDPSNIEAEEAVLGSVLINPDALFDVANFLKAEDFSLIKNRWVWEAIIAIHERNDPIDFLTIATELEDQGRLQEIGGPVYVSRLMDVVPSSIHAEAYGRMVEQTALRRRLVGAASQVAQLAYDKKENIQVVLDRAEQAIFSVSERRLTRDLQPIKDIVHQYYDRIQDLADRDASTLGIPTGFKLLDVLLGGLQRSDLLIIAGRPGMGKTGFLLGLALQAARKFRSRVALFSLEMSAEQVVGRLISAETGIDSQRLRRGTLRADEWPLFAEASGRLAETQIYIDDTPSISPLQLRTKCRRLYAEHGLDLIVLDYLQLMGGDFRTDNRVQEISYISRQLKGVARELDVPLLAAAQLSRAVEQRQSKRPMLSDLRESGSIEQDSDVVMFIYRDEYYNEETDKPNIAEISIAKHRNGPTGTVELFFQKELAHFRELETRRFDQ
ncbi:MAG: replicative DNA helicase [Anaerolineales bacterium]|nr:replicative DNA helicase [Anaerolineales bacterium]